MITKISNDNYNPIIIILPLILFIYSFTFYIFYNTEDEKKILDR